MPRSSRRSSRVSAASKVPLGVKRAQAQLYTTPSMPCAPERGPGQSSSVQAKAPVEDTAAAHAVTPPGAAGSGTRLSSLRDGRVAVDGPARETSQRHAPSLVRAIGSCRGCTYFDDGRSRPGLGSERRRSARRRPATDRRRPARRAGPRADGATSRTASPGRATGGGPAGRRAPYVVDRRRRRDVVPRAGAGVTVAPPKPGELGRSGGLGGDGDDAYRRRDRGERASACRAGRHAAQRRALDEDAGQVARTRSARAVTRSSSSSRSKAGSSASTLEALATVGPVMVAGCRRPASMTISQPW